VASKPRCLLSFPFLAAFPDGLLQALCTVAASEGCFFGAETSWLVADGRLHPKIQFISELRF